MSQTRSPLYLTSALLIAACSTSVDETSPSLAEQTRGEILEMHETAVLNHPGFYNTNDQGFAQKAEKARDIALGFADKVESPAGRKAAIDAYGAAYQDGHFVSRINEAPEVEMRWPGFLTAWRGDQALVSGAENTELDGSALLSCDGKPVDVMMRENVFAFRVAKPDQPSYWARFAPLLLLDQGNPFVDPPRRCRFLLSNGMTDERDLQWRPVPKDLRDLQTRVGNAAFGSQKRVSGMRAFSSDGYWINLPNFAPDEAEAARLTDLMEKIGNGRDALLTAETIVIDSRGNQGGNSVWGRRVAHALWGEDYANSREAGGSTAVDWRASSGNISHVRGFEAFLERDGMSDVWEQSIRPVVVGMEQALAEGAPLYRHMGGTPEADVSEKAVENPVAAKVIFITDGLCASSCLDLADTILGMEGVIHAGYPTASDSIYMEGRNVSINNGNADLFLPIKTYVGRSRTNNEFYDPEWRYEGLDWSDEALESWVLSKL